MAKVDPYFIEFRRFPGTFIMLGILFTGFEVFFDRFRYPGIFLVVLPFIVIGVLLIPYLSRWRQIEQRR